MVVLGAVALLKGLDFEEALLSWAAAGLLWWGRPAFYVRHRPLAAGIPGADRPRSPRRRVGELPGLETASFQVDDELAWTPIAVGAIGVLAVAALAYLIFRPLGPPRDLPGSRERRAASELVRAHGHDTLAFFKLRRDAHYHFNADRSAFLGYRVANG
jgi:lysylphosphatidylglycerol synthetase-like protein (DUF2156 family)